MQCGAYRFGDALQEQRAHPGIETLLVLTGHHQQADGFAASVQRQIGERAQLRGNFAEPAGGVVRGVMQADRFFLRIGERQHFRAGGIELPQALSPDEAVRLVELPADTPEAIRDKAMFELFYSSGLRLAELVNLDPAQLDMGAGEVRVTGKGSKTRIVPLGTFAIAALQAWLAIRGQLAKVDETALFVGARGNRISPRVVQLRMKQWGIRQGITSNVHPHLLRHSFATHVLQSSGDLRAVQEMLGHASISTTQVYTHLDFQYLSKIYDAAHPRPFHHVVPGPLDRKSTRLNSSH